MKAALSGQGPMRTLQGPRSARGSAAHASAERRNGLLSTRDACEKALPEATARLGPQGIKMVQSGTSWLSTGKNHVEPPWGAHRANIDMPPWDVVNKRKQLYCKLLDGQALDKAERKRALQAENYRIDLLTTTSLDGDQLWGTEARDLVGERLVMQELLCLADQKRLEATMRRAKEQEEHERWKAAEEAAHEKCFREEKTKKQLQQHRLATTWLEAADWKRGSEKALEEAVIMEERAMLEDLAQGAVPGRRLRRPKEKCLPEGMETV